MSYPHLIGQVIDKANADFEEFPDTLDGMVYLGGHAGVGWQTQPNRTPQEQADFDAEVQQELDDQADANAIKVDVTIRQLITARPQGIETYIDNNVTDLASAKDVLKILAKAVSMLGKREFR